MLKYRLVLAYLGGAYHGWQRQAGRDSIQAEVEKAIESITGERRPVVASGRTDSGVHALAQVAHFTLVSARWTCEVLQRGLNAALPVAIRVVSVEPASAAFHAQRSATGKQYSYYFQQGPCALPHYQKTSYWIRKRLDVEAMSESAIALVGKQDFTPFRAAGAKPGSGIREIFEAEVSRVEGGQPGNPLLPDGFWLVRVRVKGSGFLKQMVRGIAGTLLQVGEGRRPAGCIREILDAGERRLVGPTAPGRGLWLERVWY